jgi:hypothetical protein
MVGCPIRKVLSVPAQCIYHHLSWPLIQHACIHSTALETETHHLARRQCTHCKARQHAKARTADWQSIKTILQTTDYSCQQISEMESPSVRSKILKKIMTWLSTCKFRTNSLEIRGKVAAAGGPAAAAAPAASALPAAVPCPPCANAVAFITIIAASRRCPSRHCMITAEGARPSTNLGALEFPQLFFLPMCCRC